MDANQVVELLMTLLEDSDAGVRRMETFEAAGVLTRSAGFQVSLEGKKFQVTVVEAS